MMWFGPLTLGHNQISFPLPKEELERRQRARTHTHTHTHTHTSHTHTQTTRLLLSLVVSYSYLPLLCDFSNGTPTVLCTAASVAFVVTPTGPPPSGQMQDEAAQACWHFHLCSFYSQVWSDSTRWGRVWGGEGCVISKERERESAGERERGRERERERRRERGGEEDVNAKICQVTGAHVRGVRCRLIRWYITSARLMSPDAASYPGAFAAAVPPTITTTPLWDNRWCPHSLKARPLLQ